MLWEGFILGVSNGAACIATCAPILIPCLLGEGRGVPGNVWITAQFLLGRLSGYLLFAVAAWFVGKALPPEGPRHDLAIGVAYAAFAFLLIRYGWLHANAPCEVGCAGKGRGRLLSVERTSLPVAAGLVTGLAFCPPFLIAFAGAAGQKNLGGSLLFFLSFFAGTSLLFIPAPFVGFFRGFGALRLIGRMAAGLMGFYYLYCGIILVIGGLKTP